VRAIKGKPYGVYSGILPKRRENGSESEENPARVSGRGEKTKKGREREEDTCAGERYINGSRSGDRHLRLFK